MGSEQRQRTFHVQETLLRMTSKVFSAALKHENLGDGEKGRLEFPEDPVDAWEALLFWIFTKSLPEDLINTTQVRDEETSQLLLVQCWILGDKYEIVDFQDHIMIELLDLSTDKFISLQAAEEAFKKTLTGSKLRLFVSRLIVVAVYGCEEQKLEDFDTLEGVPGYTTQMMSTLQKWHHGAWRSHTSLMATEDGRKSAEWRDYLVGEGPKQHWLFVTEGKEPMS